MDERVGVGMESFLFCVGIGGFTGRCPWHSLIMKLGEWLYLGEGEIDIGLLHEVSMFNFKRTSSSVIPEVFSSFTARSGGVLAI